VGSRVVGMGGGVKYPPEAVGKPDVGGKLGLSAEVIASLKPDLIVVAAETGAAATLAQPMAAAGIPMLVLSYPRIESVFRNLTVLGEVLGVQPRANAVIAQMKDKLAAVDIAVKGLPRPRVYLETGAAGSGSFQTIGPGHYADDSLRLAGGRNAFPTLHGASQVTSESIALADPDRMVILTSDPALTIPMLAQRPGWDQLRAIRSGNAMIVPRGFILIPGPRQADAVTILARAIHPGLALHAP
jgi:iron complex transport system substrate-binding protein